MLFRNIDCQYQTAFVLAYKVREAIAREVETGEILEGNVKIFGAVFDGHIRSSNEKDKRAYRRLKKRQTGRRRVASSLREREGRALAFVGEQEGKAVALAQQYVSYMETMSADEASPWYIHNMVRNLGRMKHSAWLEY